jgi:hypothetical protein
MPQKPVRFFSSFLLHVHFWEWRRVWCRCPWECKWEINCDATLVGSLFVVLPMQARLHDSPSLILWQWRVEHPHTVFVDFANAPPLVRCPAVALPCFADDDDGLGDDDMPPLEPCTPPPVGPALPLWEHKMF